MMTYMSVDDFRTIQKAVAVFVKWARFAAIDDGKVSEDQEFQDIEAVKSVLFEVMGFVEADETRWEYRGIVPEMADFIVSIIEYCEDRGLPLEETVLARMEETTNEHKNL